MDILKKYNRDAANENDSRVELFKSLDTDKIVYKDKYGILTTLNNETSGNSGGLAGTNYVYVAADGTPEENAVELQAAYELAKVKVDYQESIQPLVINGFTYNGTYGMLDIHDYTLFADYGGPIQDDVVYELLFDGVSYFATPIMGGGHWVFSNYTQPPGDNYTTLSIFLNIITYNLVTVVAAPGKYSFASNFLVDTEYISIVSLTGNADILFTGLGGIHVTAKNILVKGIKSDKISIANLIDISTVFEKCIGGNNSFSSATSPSNLSGTYIDCIGGSASFAYNNTSIGKYINCVSGDNGFSNNNGHAMGEYINCNGGNLCFGATTGYTAGGVFTNCTAKTYSFGYNASGTFTNCIGDFQSFGYAGSLTGKLYYCRVKQSPFKIVSSGGRTRYCIENNDVTNNQG